MAHVSGSLFGAGTDTVRHLSFLRTLCTEMRCKTAVAVCTVLMAAAHFPEEQAKVQAELDAIIGREQGSSILHRSSVN
jgi:hypothetical protein